MKNKVLPIISMIILIAAVGFFLYPTVSVWINQMLSDSTITQYNNTVDTLSQTEKSEQLAEAKEYNREVSKVFSDSFDADSFMTDERYNSILNVTGDGQIGTVSIPSIDCHLPIFHGNSKETLTKGAVHMAFTSFPIGGESSHSVISAHTAYPGKRFFDRLTEVEMVQKGRDLVTLVTCTPYSVNTHRLLVTGERDNSPSDTIEAIPETKQINVNSSLIWGVVPLSAAIIFVTVILIRKRRKRHET